MPDDVTVVRLGHRTLSLGCWPRADRAPLLRSPPGTSALQLQLALVNSGGSLRGALLRMPDGMWLVLTTAGPLQYWSEGAVRQALNAQPAVLLFSAPAAECSPAAVVQAALAALAAGQVAVMHAGLVRASLATAAAADAGAAARPAADPAAAAAADAADAAAGTAATAADGPAAVAAQPGAAAPPQADADAAVKRLEAALQARNAATSFSALLDAEAALLELLQVELRPQGLAQARAGRVVLQPEGQPAAGALASEQPLRLPVHRCVV